MTFEQRNVLDTFLKRFGTFGSTFLFESPETNLFQEYTCHLSNDKITSCLLTEKMTRVLFQESSIRLLMIRELSKPDILM